MAAAGARGFAWFDGGATTDGWLGVDPDEEVEADDLDVLRDVEARWREVPSCPWLGWITYDVGAARLLGTKSPRGSIAGVGLRRYPAALRLAADGAVSVAGETTRGVALHRALTSAQPLARGPWPWNRLAATTDPEAYRNMVREGLDCVRAGDTYQLNLSHPFEARRSPRAENLTLSRLAAETYLHVRSATPATMGALVDAGPAWIVSNSPETLLEVRADMVEAPARATAASMPIKGTRPRDLRDASADRAHAAALVASEKDRAEHVMIVDLVRNDLGRLARPGTVRADSEPRLVSLPTVHHLVTTVQCELLPGWSLVDLFEALFPGGSITGAPKRRTAAIIDRLESTPRGIYCGALLALHPRGVNVSIPIRTALLDGTRLRLRSGGGIVIDSDPEAERLETLAKARAFDPAAAAD